jgi:hypothetical protein
MTFEGYGDAPGSRLTELRDEADAILLAVRREAKNLSWQQLSEGERFAIASASDHLAVVKQRDDTTTLRKAIDELDQVTRRLSELIIDAAVQSARRSAE